MSVIFYDIKKHVGQILKLPKIHVGQILKLPNFRDSTLTLASVAGLELNGNSEAAVA